MAKKHNNVPTNVTCEKPVLPTDTVKVEIGPISFSYIDNINKESENFNEALVILANLNLANPEGQKIAKKLIRDARRFEENINGLNKGVMKVTKVFKAVKEEKFVEVKTTI